MSLLVASSAENDEEEKLTRHIEITYANLAREWVYGLLLKSAGEGITAMPKIFRASAVGVSNMLMMLMYPKQH